MIRDDVRQLLRETRFSLIRFEEDDDIDALNDAVMMLDDIVELVSPSEVEAPPLD